MGNKKKFESIFLSLMVMNLFLHLFNSGEK